MITVLGSGIKIDELRKIKPVTPKNAGRRWKGISHGELADIIRTEAVGRGWCIREELYSTACKGAEMAGAFLLTQVGEVQAVPGTTFALGFLNSNTRRKALQITVGVSISCCANGMCTGTILLHRVHDHTVKLVDEVQAAVDRYATAAKSIPNIIKGLRAHRLTPAQASEIIMAAGRQRLIGWAAVGRVDAEYRNPTFPEHGLDTSWALLNAFTFAARRNIAPTKQMETYDKFLRMLPSAKLS